MATETQYAFFRALYEEENDRHALLEGRAKVFVTILTIYVAALSFKATEVADMLRAYRLPASFALLSGLVFVASLALCIFALRIRVYEGLADPEDLIARWPDDGIADDEFLDDRVADLAIATNRNARQNDEAARALEFAGWLLLAGVVLQAVAFLIALWR